MSFGKNCSVFKSLQELYSPPALRMCMAPLPLKGACPWPKDRPATQSALHGTVNGAMKRYIGLSYGTDQPSMTPFPVPATALLHVHASSLHVLQVLVGSLHKACRLPNPRLHPTSVCEHPVGPLSSMQGFLHRSREACSMLSGLHGTVDGVHLGERIVPPDVSTSQEVACTYRYGQQPPSTNQGYWASVRHTPKDLANRHAAITNTLIKQQARPGKARFNILTQRAT
jgi:hypothetical protein